MSRTAMIVENVFEMPLLLDRIEHFLESADDHHVALDAEKVVLGERAGGQFVADAAIVLIDRNRFEFEHPPRAHLDGINKDRFGHELCLRSDSAVDVSSLCRRRWHQER